ncbi:MAG TPA: thioredoxin [Tepidisphaeraceae bacterium]|nr:thioredoxin [Tepidisphaeraceae bacterium]
MAIITCPNCGAKNRVDDRANNLQPVCGRCKTPLSVTTFAGDHPIKVTDADFNRVTNQDIPVLIDAWAPWCGPCRMIAPIMDELAAESNGRYVVGKLNVDENPVTATHYRIDSIPTMLIFKNGKMVDRIVGLQPKQAIQGRLMSHIAQPSHS